jgi:hypothetical protein
MCGRGHPTCLQPYSHSSRAQTPNTQLILGVIRPAPDAKHRPKWNMAHHFLGRITLLSAWACIYLGIYIGHGSLTYKLDYVQVRCV